MILKDIPALRVLDTYAEHLELRCLFADMDSLHHVNNGAIGRYFEEARATVNAMFLGSDRLANADAAKVMLVNIEMDFVAQVRYPGSVTIGTGVLRIGASSWTLVHGLFQNGKCCALNRSVLVKALNDKSAPLSPEERGRMERFLIPVYEEA